MVLTEEMEKGFLYYDISQREEWEDYELNYYDDIYVSWEKKSWLGKTIRNTKKYTFKRLKTYSGKNSSFAMDNACVSFINRLKKLKTENKTESNIVVELKKEFSGTDDFSLGVQHALDVLQKNGII